MARPRIFISSTFYDLKYARVSLESFVKEMGYEPVLNERGHIPYGTEQLEQYCYQEISKVSMLISIIGGRYGTESRDNPNYYISNIEVKTAIQLGKQVYICIDAGVYSEFSTYRKNKGKDIEYSHVDNKKVYEFIEEINDLPRNNQIFPFGEIPQLIMYLKEQWAGLFEGFLEAKSSEKPMQSLIKIEDSVKTLDQLINVLKRDIVGQSGNKTDIQSQLDSLLIQNHPLFSTLRQKLRSHYRVFFTNRSEMFAWLRGSKGAVDISDIPPTNDDYFEYEVNLNKETYHLYISRNLFDMDERLLPMQPSMWNDDNVLLIKQTKKDDDDDIPF